MKWRVANSSNTKKFPSFIIFDRLKNGSNATMHYSFFPMFSKHKAHDFGIPPHLGLWINSFRPTTKKLSLFFLWASTLSRLLPNHKNRHTNSLRKMSILTSLKDWIRSSMLKSYAVLRHKRYIYNFAHLKKRWNQ